VQLHVMSLARRGRYLICALAVAGLAAGTAVAVSPAWPGRVRVPGQLHGEPVTGAPGSPPRSRSRTPDRRSPAGRWATPTRAARSSARAVGHLVPVRGGHHGHQCQLERQPGDRRLGQIGANFTYSGTNAAPTAFTLNGVACNGAPARHPPHATASSSPTPLPPRPRPARPGSCAAAARVRQQAGQRQRPAGRAARRGRSGTEYACVQGNGIFDGPNDQASITAMKNWGVTRSGSRSTRRAGTRSPT